MKDHVRCPKGQNARKIFDQPFSVSDEGSKVASGLPSNRSAVEVTVVDRKRSESSLGPAGLPSNWSAVEVTVVDQKRGTHVQKADLCDPSGLPSNRSAVEVTADQACKSRLNMSPPRNSSPRLRARG